VLDSLEEHSGEFIEVKACCQAIRVVIVLGDACW
jgi:hypothetical protein